jgi:hypothetical protein
MRKQCVPNGSLQTSAMCTWCCIVLHMVLYRAQPSDMAYPCDPYVTPVELRMTTTMTKTAVAVLGPKRHALALPVRMGRCTSSHAHGAWGTQLNIPRKTCLFESVAKCDPLSNSLDPVRPAQEHAPNDAPTNTIQLINNNAQANNNTQNIARST